VKTGVHPHPLNLDTVFQRYDGRRASLDAGLEFILHRRTDMSKSHFAPKERNLDIPQLDI